MHAEMILYQTKNYLVLTFSFSFVRSIFPFFLFISSFTVLSLRLLLVSPLFRSIACSLANTLVISYHYYYNNNKYNYYYNYTWALYILIAAFL